MQHDAAKSDWRYRGLIEYLPERWRTPLARMSLAWLAVFTVTLRDWGAMAHQWWNVSTYNHILFVPLIVGWFVWLRRGELEKIEPGGWTPGLILLAGAMFIWLLGTVTGVNTLSQLGVVTALQSCVLAFLGPRVVAALVFPLAYSLFLVPFGDELIPPLQLITAEIAIALTHWSGVPAVVDGVFIDTPVGLFEVAEACSGVKFLIAMMALGALVAHSCFTSWKRRIPFLVAALTLPIVANGIRAWATIYIAQFQGIEFAEGFDHIFYGWVFFGLVIAVLLAASWRWFDRDPDEVQVSAEAINANPRFDRLGDPAANANAVLLVAIGLIAGASVWGSAAVRAEAQLPAAITPPVIEGWSISRTQPQVAWEPSAVGADRRRMVRYVDQAGREVDVFVALYAAQDHDSDPTARNQGALPLDTPWRWLEGGRASSEMREDVLFAFGETKRIAQTSFRTGDTITASPTQLKVASMRDRMLVAPKVTSMLIVSAEGRERDELQQRIDDFTTAMGNRTAWIDRAAGLR